jgi:nitrogen regulatory protein PII
MLVLEKNLLYSIVRYGDSGRFVELARSQGAGGATVFLAKGTASSSVLRVLGLGEKRREVVLVLAGEETARSIIKAAQKDNKIEGVSILIGNAGEEDMDTKLKMITVIVNSGYAEDVMDAARKAGATGGTITHARGTAPNDGSEKFFGVTIVPEKEMITIVADQEKTKAIVQAIKTLPCLQTPGVGVLYVQDVKEFENLGTK